MTNHKFTKKQFAALGLRKSATGDYIFIDPNEAHKSKYNPILKNKSKLNNEIIFSNNKEK